VEHARAQELLSDYLEGELEAADRVAVEAHLSGCEECRRDLESLQATLQALSRLAAAEPSPDFMDEVRKKLKRRGNSPLDVSYGLDRKLPFEAVSLVFICILLALYLILVIIPTEELTHDPKPGKTTLIRPDAGPDANSSR
jgi:anti-sigma factor RsiW